MFGFFYFGFRPHGAIARHGATSPLGAAFPGFHYFDLVFRAHTRSACFAYRLAGFWGVGAGEGNLQIPKTHPHTYTHHGSRRKTGKHPRLPSPPHWALVVKLLLLTIYPLCIIYYYRGTGGGVWQDKGGNRHRRRTDGNEKDRGRIRVPEHNRAPLYDSGRRGAELGGSPSPPIISKQLGSPISRV